MRCPIHKKTFYNEQLEVCPVCKENKMRVIISEWDKQQRHIDTMTHLGQFVFRPDRSKAILIFDEENYV